MRTFQLFFRAVSCVNLFKSQMNLPWKTDTDRSMLDLKWFPLEFLEPDLFGSFLSRKLAAEKSLLACDICLQWGPKVWDYIEILRNFHVNLEIIMRFENVFIYVWLKLLQKRLKLQMKNLLELRQFCINHWILKTSQILDLNTEWTKLIFANKS